VIDRPGFADGAVTVDDRTVQAELGYAVHPNGGSTHEVGPLLLRGDSPVASSYGDASDRLRLPTATPDTTGPPSEPRCVSSTRQPPRWESWR